MPLWISDLFAKSNAFIPHGHCYLWIPSLLWLHVISDALIGAAYVGISLILYVLVRKIRLPFSPVFIAFGLFIGLCGLTHFMAIWTVWNPDYWLDGLIKAATAAASVATAIGLLYIRPQIEELVHAARLSEERREQLETSNAELEALYTKVKEVDELKTQFFANVSHELRTPLALILGPADRLLEEQNLTEQQRRQLQSISRNGKSLLKQVNDLLDVAQLEEGQKRLRYARFDLVPWLNRIIGRFETAAEQRHINFEAIIPPELIAEADPDMLERVFVNLLSNAFKFTPEGGAIRLELRVTGADCFTFSVTDTGPGVDPQQYEQIFERFRQTDGGSTRRHGGTGLGLAIVKDFVDLHGGRVDVMQGAEGGARFEVELPRRATGHEVREGLEPADTMTEIALDSAVNELMPSASDDSGAYDGAAQDRPAVLVVEDTPDMSRFIKEVLQRNYQVITAVDGREGLDKALALRPDLIITDIMMPRMSGDQLVAELRSRNEFDAVPILLLSAKADENLRVELLKSGAQDYLTKPFLPQELVARAANLVAVKRSGDALRDELLSTSADLEALAHELALKHRQLQTALDTTEVAREQAERASQVKSQFLAMISHEMRTPLSTINLNAQLLGRRQSEAQAGGYRLQVERVVRATQQLSSLIEGLLEYTRVESGRLQAKSEVVDVVAAAREAVDIGKLQISTDEVQLSLAVADDDEFPPCKTDPRLLRVVLNNLLTNALKFTARGTVSLHLSKEEGWLTFEVRDTGIGIPKEDLPRIFSPFEQLEPVQRKSIPGVGLGLSLVKEIVGALNGSVEVTSEPNIGSTFRVKLPVENA